MMSNTIVHGYGICASDIETTAEKLLKLARMNSEVEEEIREYLSGMFPDGYEDNDLTIEDFDNFEGYYNERGVASVLRDLIDTELPVEYVDSYGDSYILYMPNFPWDMNDQEKNLTQQDVEKIFEKYIKVLTDEYVEFVLKSL